MKDKGKKNNKKALKSKKRPSKRSSTKFPGLVHKVNSKVKQEYMDQDYIDKLSDKEKQWLSNFNEEFYGGCFNHPGKILHTSKKKKRECYNRNNARNRCVYGLKKAGGKVVDHVHAMFLEREEAENRSYNPETDMIEYLDQKGKKPIPEGSKGDE